MKIILIKTKETPNSRDFEEIYSTLESGKEIAKISIHSLSRKDYKYEYDFLNLYSNRTDNLSEARKDIKNLIKDTLSAFGCKVRFFHVPSKNNATTSN